MDPVTAATIATAGGQVLNAGAGLWGQKRQHKYNLKLAQYTNKQNIENWNRTNLYNSPAMQMQRLREGGLNPNLMYGKGDTGHAGNLPAYQQAGVNQDIPKFNFLDVIGAYQDTRMKQANIDNVEEQNRIIKADADIRAIELKFKRDMLMAELIQKRNSGDIGYQEYLKLKEEMTAVYGIDEDQSGFYENKYGLVSATAGDEQRQKNRQRLRDVANSELERTQSSVLGQKLLNDIRNFEKEFLNMGGKYWNPALQTLKFIFGR